LLHACAEEGGLFVSHLEPSELFGINRDVFLVEVGLRNLRPTEGVCQSVGARSGLGCVEYFEVVDDVRAIDAVLSFRCGVEVRPDQVRLGMVRMVVPFVLSRVAAPAALCALETEGCEDRRLDLLEGGGGHVQSSFRFVCLTRPSLEKINFK